MMSLELESKEEIGKRIARVLRVFLAWVRISVLLLGEWAMSNSGPLMDAVGSYEMQKFPWDTTKTRIGAMVWQSCSVIDLANAIATI